MWRRIYVVWTDFSEEHIASIFMVEKATSEEPAWEVASCYLYGATFQKTEFFIVTAVDTSNPILKDILDRLYQYFGAVFLKQERLDTLYTTSTIRDKSVAVLNLVISKINTHSKLMAVIYMYIYTYLFNLKRMT
jgi:hypothetical protein